MLVLLSLTWQVILIIFGARRKHARGSFISALVWVTYLSADWLATFSLGTLARQDSDANVVLQAVWAPFLLLHLGGPDTITAYSLEDNSLWLRHLLGLLVQVTVAFYVYVRSWSSSPLTFVAIPVFVSGVIKYMERTLALRSASPVQFEDSLLSAPTLQASDLKHIHDDPELELVHQGYSLFPMLKRLYADLSLRFAEGQRSYSLIVKKNKREIKDIQQQQQQQINDAFEVVEVQLGFLYDMLYTKAPMIYSLPGLFFRFISVVSTVSALVAFVVFVDTNGYSRLDVCITFGLFIGAISLELYAFISLILSDWTMRWLTKNKSSPQNFIKWALRHGQKRWSGYLAQHNLLSFCMKKRVARCIRSDLLFRIYFGLELYWQRTWKRVDNDLKKLIFQQLLEKHKAYDKSGFDNKVLKELLSRKGDYVLNNNKCLDEIGWSVEVEFDYSLLIWHVATDIYYYSTPEKDKNNECKASKMLSDYMLYILLMRPFLLPKWIDRITHVRDTFREAIRILQRRQFPVKVGADASRMLIQMYRQSHQPLEQLRKEKSDKSVLLDGCRLASQLQDLRCPWEMICQVWIEMLTFAASQCEWEAHAQQLRRGGELLTHVCVLMADFGLSQQFDIGRRGPPVESQNEGWGWVNCKILDPYK